MSEIRESRADDNTYTEFEMTTSDRNYDTVANIVPVKSGDKKVIKSSNNKLFFFLIFGVGATLAVTVVVQLVLLYLVVQNKSEVSCQVLPDTSQHFNMLDTAAFSKYLNEIAELLENNSVQAFQELRYLNKNLTDNAEIMKNSSLQASQELNDLKNKCTIPAEWQMNSTEKIINTIKYGSSSSLSSCSDILQAVPNSPSGYYRVKSSNGTDIYVYCDMTRSCGGSTGGWTRVAKLDMTDPSAECPPGLCLNATAPRTCRICNYEGTCSLDSFFVGSSYSKVCGRIIGYQIGSPDGLHPVYANGVDGIILTYGNETKNIWTFAVTHLEFELYCPCITGADAGTITTPNSIGTNYFCDIGTYQTDPLWDGAGCEGASTCCTFNNPPWFYIELKNTTTEDIKMKICRDENRGNEDIAIQVLEIYAK